MKTLEEIKNGLECCISDTYGCYEKCPYFNSLSNGVDCAVKMHADALAYIKQLEACVPKWISVKDRLPEDQRSVLTVNGHGEIRIMGLWSKCDDKWTWVHNDRMMHYNDITHWMLLPSTEGLK